MRPNCYRHYRVTVSLMSDPKGQPPQRSPAGMVKAPNSLRAAEIVVGVITIVLAGFVLAFPGFAIFLIVIWLAISLLFGGIDGIVIGAGAKHLSKGGRALSIGLGAVAIALSIAVFAFPAAAALTLTLLLSIALLFLGAGSIARGISEKRIPRWARGMLVAVGAVTIGLSIPVMIFPAFGLSILFTFISAALIINGASYIVAGITGAIFQPLYPGLGRGKTRSWESDAA